MEVRIDAVPGCVLPPESYVAVRVGDVQKQSRFSPPRTYSFPASCATRQHCRVDVFRRVGSSSVNLDVSSELQEVRIPCCGGSEAGMEELRLSLATNLNQVLSSEERAQKQKLKADAARTYLSEHNLEELLSQAMKLVLRDKPANPYRFLSNLILLQQPQAPPGADYPTLPHPSAMHPSPPKMMGGNNKPPPHPVSGSMGGPMWVPSNKQQQLAPLDHRPMPKASNIPASTPDPLKSHSPFTAAPVLQISSSPADTVSCRQDLAVVASPPKLYLQTPSVGTWCVRRCARPRCLTDTTVQVPAVWNNLPSVGTWISAKPFALELPGESAAQAVAWNYRPSVGTWCASLPIHDAARTGDAPVIEVLGASSQQKAKTCMKRHDSILQMGANERVEYIEDLQQEICTRDQQISDLQARLAELQNLTAASIAEREAPTAEVDITDLRKKALKTLAKGEAEGTLEQLLQQEVVDSYFCFRPSVGTWFCSKPFEDDSTPDTLSTWCLRPSVGTWLAPTPSWANDEDATLDSRAPNKGTRFSCQAECSTPPNPDDLSEDVRSRQWYMRQQKSIVEMPQPEKDSWIQGLQEEVRLKEERIQQLKDAYINSLQEELAKKDSQIEELETKIGSLS